MSTVHDLLVLVVHDDPEARQALTTRILRLGACVCEVSQSKEAFTLLLSRHFDAVFTATEMPPLTNLRPELPVIHLPQPDRADDTELIAALRKASALACVTRLAV